MPVIAGLMAVFLLAGTAGMPADAAAPTFEEPPLAIASASYTLTLTGYNAVPWQTDDTPFETASGAYTNPEVVAARSQDLGKELPFGTIVEIVGPESDTPSCNYNAVAEHIGYRVIADTMNARLRKRIDVVFSVNDKYLLPGGRSINAASLLGACAGTQVRVVGFVDIKNPANLPKTQEELASLVHKSFAFGN